MWYNTIAEALRQVGIGLLAASLAFGPALGQSSLLPDGKQQFLSNTGVPLASGKVFMYVPNTSTFKNTWQDAAQMTLNTNPVILDSSGRALIYGSGIYRQLVQTSAGVTIYDALTTSTLTQTDIGYFIGNATSTGSANAQAVAATTPSTFALTTGFTLTFKPGFTNTGAMTLNVGGTGVRTVVKPAYTGQGALTGGEVVANSMTAVVYDGTNYMLQSMPDGFGINTALASAATTDLGTVASHSVQISGTTGITSFGSSASLNYGYYFVSFSGALTITNSAAIATPGNADITTAAADSAILRYNGSGNWRILQYTKAAVPPYPGLSTAFTKQYLISGTTYTTPAGARTIVVRGCGGGGGGAAANTTPGAAGGTTTFNSINANGGSGGVNTNGAGGAGGTGGTGSANLRLNGAPGEHTPSTSLGGRGAAGFLGLGGGLPGAGIAAGAAAQANSCSGGGGGSNAATNAGSGGGAGEYIEIIISSPTTSYTYAIGALGAGGAGTQAGGNGGSGILVVEEYYKFLRSVCGESANDNYDFEMCKAM